MVALFQQLSGGPDLNDCSVLFLARKLDALLLAGDKPLRIEAERRRIEVHGTLWILDQLVAEDVISTKNAAARLRGLLDAGRFLPLGESEKRIRLWERNV
jgi:predicted nucleic acid-binding protein